jgi:general L-amino acid transport system permease protein
MSDTHARTVAYVRDTMLPEAGAAGDRTRRGQVDAREPVQRLAQHLLTVLSLYVVFWLVAHIGALVHANSVWNAGSLAECREIPRRAEGACWGVINDRWHQLLFGFYPPQLYWRPVLTLVLLLVALAPILFTWAAAQADVVLVIYPFLAFFLLWGGSIWLPVSAALGFVAGYARVLAACARLALVAPFAAFLAPVLWWLIARRPLRGARQDMIPIGIDSSAPTGFRRLPDLAGDRRDRHLAVAAAGHPAGAGPASRTCS